MSRFVLLSILFSCCPGSAQEADLEKGLADIVRRLDSEEAAQREAAQADLHRIVEQHLETIQPFLKKRQEGASPEVRQRLQTELEFVAKIEDLRKLVSPFDTLELPSVAGMTFVVFNSGCASRGENEMHFLYSMGWVLAESDGEMKLLENNLGVTTYKRDHTLPKDWDRFKDQQPKDAPLPGDRKEIDFADFCRKFISADVKSYFGAFEHYWSGGLPHGVEAYLYASWALQRREWQNAFDLAALGEKSVRQEQERAMPRNKGTVPQVIAGNLATNFRWRAINAANGGRERRDLLEDWKRIGRLPANEWTTEAAEMVKAYESLIDEDREFHVQGADAVASLKPEEQVRYWMHLLRDHNAMQMMQPGSCCVLGGWGARDDKANPADQLVKLGWDALPEVIAHLDDARPTRCVGYWRNFAIGSFYLLRYGDCCQQVFEAITGEEIYRSATTSGSMIRDGRAASAKEQAEKWWKENSAQGREGYLLKVLDSKDAEGHPHAAKGLLEIDAGKHLPHIMEVAARKDHPRRAELLDEMRDHLGMAQREYLEGFLADARADVVVAAGWCLWKACASDSGAREVVKRLRTLGDRTDLERGFVIENGLRLLLAVGGDTASAGICDLLKDSPTAVRYEALQQAYALPDPRVAEVLAGLLTDRKDTGWTSSVRLRVCDTAARSLTEMLQSLTPPPAATKDEDRDGCVSALQAWWEAHKASIDWQALRQETKNK